MPAVLCCAVLCCAVLCCAVLCTTLSLPAQLYQVSHSLLVRLMGQNLKHGQPLRLPGELRTGQLTTPLPRLQRLHPTSSLLCQAHLQLTGIQSRFISPLLASVLWNVSVLCLLWCCSHFAVHVCGVDFILSASSCSGLSSAAQH